jgi:hypothetical protein
MIVNDILVIKVIKLISKIRENNQEYLDEMIWIFSNLIKITCSNLSLEQS